MTAVRRWWAVAGCVAWAGLIFATSSTVVTPQAFFAWFNENLFTTEESFGRFQLFWGACWILVVKGWHVTEFAILTVLATWAIDGVVRRRARGHVIAAAAIATIYAASDEWHQTFVPRRGGLVSDVAIDAIGVVASAVWLWRGRKPSPPSPEAD